MMAVHVLPAVGKDGGVTVTHAIAGGRSAATFAVMAGVGLGLLTGGTSPYRDRRWAAAAAGLVVRAAAIGAVGLLLGLADARVAVILAYYGLLFVVAIPLLPLRARPLIALALAVACLAPVLSHLLREDNLVAFTGRNPTFATLLDTPRELVRALFLTGYYPVLAWTAYLCAGLAAGRLPLRERRTAAWLFGGGAALAVAASTGTHPPPPGGGWRWSRRTPARRWTCCTPSAWPWACWARCCWSPPPPARLARCSARSQLPEA